MCHLADPKLGKLVWERISLWFTLALGIGAVSACSGSQDQDEAVKPSTEESGDLDDAKAAPAPADTAAAAVASEDKATGEASAVSGSPASAAIPANPAPAPSVASTPAAEAASAGAPNKARVVRYVRVKQTELRAEPSASAPAVGQLVKGDRILVVEEEGWGRIADGIFVNLKDTAKKAIAPKREPAQWSLPAH